MKALRVPVGLRMICQQRRSFSTTKPSSFLQGVYAPIITTYDKNSGEISPSHLKSNVAALSKSKLKGLVVLGSNGEFPLLTKEEKLQVLGTAIQANKENGGRMKMIAGTGAVSTRETIDLTRAAGELGYSAALVVTPYYYTSRITPAILREHFTAVADKSPIPIILYNVPPFASVTIPVDLVVELSKHPNIIGVKDTTGSIPQIAETARRVGEDFIVMAGTGGFFLQALVSGAKGAVVALGNILPNEVVQIQEQFDSRAPLTKVLDLQTKLTLINEVATMKFGIGGLKYACEYLGYYGGDARAPLPAVTQAQKEEIKKVLDDFKKWQSQ